MKTICYLCMNYWEEQHYINKTKYRMIKPHETCDICNCKYSTSYKDTVFGYFLTGDFSGGFDLEFKIGPYCNKCFEQKKEYFKFSNKTSDSKINVELICCICDRNIY